MHVQVLEEFYNIFGPELKAVTGDPKRIDEVLQRVDLLVEPLERVPTSTHVQLAYYASSQIKVVAYSATVIITIEGCGTGMSKLVCDDVWFLCGCFQY